MHEPFLILTMSPSNPADLNATVSQFNPLLPTAGKLIANSKPAMAGSILPAALR
jgi:hypothetical protein